MKENNLLSYIKMGKGYNLHGCPSNYFLQSNLNFHGLGGRRALKQVPRYQNKQNYHHLFI